MPEQRHLLLMVEDIDNTQRNQIQAAIKKRADEWWHDFADVWVFRTAENAQQWQTRLQVVFDVGGGCRFILLTLMEKPDILDFGMFASKSTIEWFLNIYGQGKNSEVNQGAGGYDDEPPF